MERQLINSKKNAFVSLLLFSIGSILFSCSKNEVLPKTVFINQSVFIKNITLSESDSILVKDNINISDEIVFIISSKNINSVIKPNIILNDGYSFEVKNEDATFITLNDLNSGFDFYKKKALKIFKGKDFVGYYQVRVKFSDNIIIKSVKEQSPLIAGQFPIIKIELDNVSTIDSFTTTVQLEGGNEFRRVFITYNNHLPSINFPIQSVLSEGEYILSVRHGNQKKIIWSEKLIFSKGEITFFTNSNNQTMILTNKLGAYGYFYSNAKYEVEIERVLPDRKIIKIPANYINVSSITFTIPDTLKDGAYRLNYLVDGEKKQSSIINKVKYGIRPYFDSISSETFNYTDTYIIKLWNCDICLKNTPCISKGFRLIGVIDNKEYELEIEKVKFCDICFGATAYLKVPTSIPKGKYYFKYFVCSTESYDWWTVITVE